MAIDFTITKKSHRGGSKSKPQALSRIKYGHNPRGRVYAQCVLCKVRKVVKGDILCKTCQAPT